MAGREADRVLASLSTTISRTIGDITEATDLDAADAWEAVLDLERAGKVIRSREDGDTGHWQIRRAS